MKLQPPTLEKSAQISWAKYVLRNIQTILQENDSHILIDRFRETIQDFINERIPPSMHEKLLQEGLHLIMLEIGRGSSSSKIAGIFLSILYMPHMRSLEWTDNFDEEDLIF